MPARRKKSAVRRKRARKAARPHAAAHKAAAKAAAKAGGLEAFARKILRATLDPRKFVIADLYTRDCESTEASGDVARGHEGIQKKLDQWEQMQKGMKAKARHVVLGRNVICIEWDNDVTLNDGRTVKMREVAVHEIKGGKIHRERYYYNPMSLMPAQT